MAVAETAAAHSAAMLAGPTRLVDWLAVFPIALPLLGAALTLMLRHAEEWQGRIALIALGLAGVFNLGLLVRVLEDGPMTLVMGNWLPPFGIAIAVDPVSAVFVAAAAIVGLIGAVYSFGDIDAGRRRFGFYTFYLLLIAGVSGAFTTGDIFNLYVWFEVFLVASFGLLVLGGERPQLDGAVKYGVLNLLGTTFFLIAIAYLYGLTGTLNMADLTAKVAALPLAAPVMAVTALFMLGFSMKAAAFPLHFWLPASYHTPRIVVGAIFGGLLTKVGIYSLLRIVLMLLPASGARLSGVIVVVAAATAVIGALGALAQSDMRRLVGWLVVSGIGVMLIGIGLASELAVTGVIVYAVHSILAMTALFLTVGTAERISGARSLGEAGGLYRTHPLVAALFLVFGFAISGLPPFSGFWPKVMLIRAAINLETYWLAFIVVLNGFLTTIAIGRVWLFAFLREAPPSAVSANRPPGVPMAGERAAWAVPLAALALLVMLLGIVPNPLISAAGTGAAGLLDPAVYIRSVLGS